MPPDQTRGSSRGSHSIASERLRQIAETLDVPIETFDSSKKPYPLFEDSTGSCWLLLRDAQGIPMVRHMGNANSDHPMNDEGIAAFLQRNPGSLQHQALLTLIEHLLVLHLVS